MFANSTILVFGAFRVKLIHFCCVLLCFSACYMFDVVDVKAPVVVCFKLAADLPFGGATGLFSNLN